MVTLLGNTPIAAKSAKENVVACAPSQSSSPPKKEPRMSFPGALWPQRRKRTSMIGNEFDGAALVQSLEHMSTLERRGGSSSLAVHLSAALSNLQHLDLSASVQSSKNPRSLNGLANILARCPSLVTLNVASTNLQDSGLRLLVEATMSGMNSVLRELDISRNQLRNGNLLAQLLASPAQRLVSLNLEANELNDLAVAALSAGLSVNTQLQLLNLAGNVFGDAGAIALAQSVWQQRRAQAIGSARQEVLKPLMAKWLLSLPLLADFQETGEQGNNCGLQQLDLSLTLVADDGAEALASTMGDMLEDKAPILRWVNLFGTQVSSRGRIAFEETLQMSHKRLKRFAEEAFTALGSTLVQSPCCVPMPLCVQGLGLETMDMEFSAFMADWAKRRDITALVINVLHNVEESCTMESVSDIQDRAKDENSGDVYCCAGKGKDIDEQSVHEHEPEEEQQAARSRSNSVSADLCHLCVQNPNGLSDEASHEKRAGVSANAAPTNYEPGVEVMQTVQQEFEEHSAKVVIHVKGALSAGIKGQEIPQGSAELHSSHPEPEPEAADAIGTAGQLDGLHEAAAVMDIVVANSADDVLEPEAADTITEVWQLDRSQPGALPTAISSIGTSTAKAAVPISPAILVKAKAPTIMPAKFTTAPASVVATLKGVANLPTSKPQVEGVLEPPTSKPQVEGVLEPPIGKQELESVVVRPIVEQFNKGIASQPQRKRSTEDMVQPQIMEQSGESKVDILHTKQDMKEPTELSHGTVEVSVVEVVGANATGSQGLKGKGKGKGKAPPPPRPKASGEAKAPGPEGHEDGGSPSEQPTAPPPNGESSSVPLSARTCKGGGKGPAPPAKGKGGPPPGKGDGKGKGLPPKAAGKAPGFKRGTGNTPTKTTEESAPPFRRKLYWQPLDLTDAEGTVFSGSGVKIDEEALQRVFKGDSNKVATAEAKARSWLQKLQCKAEGVKVLSENRARNTAIVLRRLPVSVEMLVQILQGLLWEIVDIGTDQMEQVLEVMPTPQESKELRAHGDTPEAVARLRDVERLALPLAELRRAPARVRLICCARNANSQSDFACQQLATFREACHALRNSSMLREVLHVALAMGNYINHGDSSKGAKAITVGSLLQLREYRAGRTSSLHFLCAQLLCTDPMRDAAEVLQCELQPVKAASLIQAQGLTQVIRTAEQDFKFVETESKAAAQEYDDGEIQSGQKSGADTNKLEDQNATQKTEQKVTSVTASQGQDEDALNIRGTARQRLLRLVPVMERINTRLRADIEQTELEAQDALKFCGIAPTKTGETLTKFEPVLGQLAEFTQIFAQHWNEVQSDLPRYREFFPGLLRENEETCNASSIGLKPGGARRKSRNSSSPPRMVRRPTSGIL